MSLNQCFWMFPEWYYRNGSLLGTLNASNLLQYAIHRFYFYHYVFGLASTGLQTPEAQMSPHECFRDVPQRYYRDLSLLGPCWPSNTIGEGAPPTLDQA